MRTIRSTTDRFLERRRQRRVWRGALALALGVSWGCDRDPCRSPQAVSEPEGSGLAECSDGSYVRVASAQCAASESVDRCPVEGEPACKVGAVDCPDLASPVCSSSQVLWGHSVDCACYESCQSDADCPAGTLCMCGSKGDEMNAVVPTSNRCVPAECRTDADCSGPGAHCVMQAPRSLAEAQFYCRDATDKCQGDDDCGSSERCLYDTDTSKWACKPGGVD